MIKTSLKEVLSRLCKANGISCRFARVKGTRKVEFTMKASGDNGGYAKEGRRLWMPITPEFLEIVIMARINNLKNALLKHGQVEAAKKLPQYRMPG